MAGILVSWQAQLIGDRILEFVQVRQSPLICLLNTETYIVIHTEIANVEFVVIQVVLLPFNHSNLIYSNILRNRKPVSFCDLINPFFIKSVLDEVLLILYSDNVFKS